EHLALRGGLEAEIADQAAAIPSSGREHTDDDVQRAPQALPRGERLVVERLLDGPLEIGEIAVQHLPGERLLGAEVIGEGALGSARGGAAVPNRRPRGTP